MGAQFRMSLVNILDYISKQSKILIVNDKTYLIKDYATELGILKWYMVILPSFTIKKYPLRPEPLERLKREVAFMRKTRDCFNKPEILLVDYGKLKLVREFIRGEIYSYKAPSRVHYEVGHNLGICHASGWALGDSKITNFIYRDDKVYIIDAEQAINECNLEYAAWDLLVLISTILIDGYGVAMWADHFNLKVVDNILEGYLAGNRDGREVLNTLRSGEFKLLAYLLIPFPLNYIFLKRIENY